MLFKLFFCAHKALCTTDNCTRVAMQHCLLGQVGAWFNSSEAWLVKISVIAITHTNKPDAYV